MTRLSEGDRSAFRPVFDFLQPLLRRFVARQLASADAEDVAQQALLRIFERSSQFDPALSRLARTDRTWFGQADRLSAHGGVSDLGDVVVRELVRSN